MLRHSLKEFCRQSITVSKTDEASICWHNTVFAVRTPKEIYIFEFAYDINYMDKTINMNQYMIPTPKSSPATYLVSNNFIKYGVSNFELTQLIMDPSLWPHSAQIVQEMASVIDCKWSPDASFNREPLLAVLNNIGNVTLFGKQNGTWTNLLDLSACVNKELNLVLPTCVEDLKTKADTVESSALCFIPTNDESCSIILGQKNGNIHLWSLKVKNDDNLIAYFRGSIEDNSNEVKCVLWIEKCGKNGLLVVSNVIGQIILYECSINTKIKMLNKHLIWPHRDNMVTQYLNYTKVNNKIILFYDKHRHFIVQTLDENYKVLSQYAENINDYKISSIAVNSNEFLLATTNFQIFQINFDFSNGNLVVKHSLIEIKDSYNNYEVLDLGSSQNRRMITAVAVDRSVNIRKRNLQIDILFLTTELNDNSNLPFLIHNEIKSIINLWDAIVLVRQNILKSKILPLSELTQLIADGEMDTYYLKLYLVIANVWQTLENNLRIPNSRKLLPVDVEKVKEKVILKHAQSQLNEFHKLIIQNCISNFDKESFNATKSYLNYYSQKYNLKLESLISPIVYNSLNEEKKYTCQCCDNEIEGFSCDSGHLNMFCPVSFLPIETSDYLICVVCGITARIELYNRKAKCIFCDKHLQKC
ncbi:uncharacterized protein LOC128679087 [Plodia interpunctella]|uniref:uncharacterized protein LOC128679087 n=1 Tax=Plodia interpunctella TaxID=58824 RepID=UPI002367FE1B|nr:uncharacterized protein LOC128679087 [Plodia interpunctella]